MEQPQNTMLISPIDPYSGVPMVIRNVSMLRFSPVDAPTAGISFQGSLSPSLLGQAAVIDYDIPQVQETVCRHLTLHFRANHHILRAVYRNETGDNRLYYSIVLKDDTDENRSVIFSILDEPMIDFYALVSPVYFQFYPKHLEDQIAYAEKIDL